MTKTWHDLKTIYDFIECCEEDVQKYSPDLDKKKKENLAAAILSLTFSDHFDKWYEDYPVVEEIQALSSDLEWSNSSDIDGDWEKLIQYVNDLAGQVGDDK